MKKKKGRRRDEAGLQGLEDQVLVIIYLARCTTEAGRKRSLYRKLR